MISSIASFFHEGGFWMWPIFAAQVLSIAIIVERILALYVFRAQVNENVINGIGEDIKKGELDRAVAKAQSIGTGNAISSVIIAGAQAAQNMGGREEIQAKMDEVLLTENTRLEKRTSYLAMLGNVGTLLGLLGTIVGMIRSFGSISNANPAEKASILASGISEAMNATAYGLIVAIPALVMFTVLQNRAHQLTSEMNQGALKIFNLLSFHYDSIPSARKSKSAR